jgi:hypothetical protein
MLRRVLERRPPVVVLVSEAFSSAVLIILGSAVDAPGVGAGVTAAVLVTGLVTRRDLFVRGFCALASVKQNTINIKTASANVA